MISAWSDDIRTSNISSVASAVGDEARARDASNDELSGSLALAVDVCNGSAAGALSTLDEAVHLCEIVLVFLQGVARRSRFKDVADSDCLK